MDCTLLLGEDNFWGFSELELFFFSWTLVSLARYVFVSFQTRLAPVSLLIGVPLPHLSHLPRFLSGNRQWLKLLIQSVYSPAELLHCWITDLVWARAQPTGCLFLMPGAIGLQSILECHQCRPRTWLRMGFQFQLLLLNPRPEIQPACLKAEPLGTVRPQEINPNSQVPSNLGGELYEWPLRLVLLEILWSHKDEDVAVS